MSILGKLIYQLYYHPKGKKAIIEKFGGKQNYLEMLAAEQEMKKYALMELRIDSNFNKEGQFKLNFLTGDNFIHQTLFCTYSFFKFLTPQESANFSVCYYSDGTLSDPVAAALHARFPQIKVITFQESKAALRDHLPQSRFPYLNKKVNSLPLFKKLIYPHLDNKGSAIFFDSDMLFLKRPEVFLNWLFQKGSSKEHTFCILDVERCYGYTDQQIRKVWPDEVKNNINSGMYAIFSEHMDLPFIEGLVKEFEGRYGSQYYLEQLVTAIVLEKTGNLFVAPPSEYIVLPSQYQIQAQTGTLHHYVNQSKELYFKESWRKQLVHVQPHLAKT
jgi:hypothetical protein